MPYYIPTTPSRLMRTLPELPKTLYERLRELSPITTTAPLSTPLINTTNLLSVWFPLLDPTVQNESCLQSQLINLLARQLLRSPPSKLRSVLPLTMDKVINRGSVNKLTSLRNELSRNAAAAVFAVSLAAALVKLDTAATVLTQEYLRLLTIKPKLKGDEHISSSFEPADAEDDNKDEDNETPDEDEEEENNNEKIEATKGSADGAAAGGVEENGEEEEDGEQDDKEDPDEDGEENAEDEEEDDDDDEDEEEDDGGEEEDDEEEEEDEEEETIQPPKKRKK